MRSLIEFVGISSATEEDAKSLLRSWGKSSEILCIEDQLHIYLCDSFSPNL